MLLLNKLIRLLDSIDSIETYAYVVSKDLVSNNINVRKQYKNDLV